MIVTIDGPVASGKSTLSRIVADKLEFYYVCSGLIYRAIAYVLVNHYGYTPETLINVSAEDLSPCTDPKRLQYNYDQLSHERVFFDQEDITTHLKDKFIDHVTSIVSVNKDVRKSVTAIQRNIAQSYDIVIDGRDVGSVVFPEADIKFFITASIAIRAERWRKVQERYDNHVSLQEAITLISDRDERDRKRVVAPLIVPENAIIIDTSELTIEQAMEKMLDYIKEYRLSAL